MTDETITVEESYGVPVMPTPEQLEQTPVEVLRFISRVMLENLNLGETTVTQHWAIQNLKLQLLLSTKGGEDG